MGSMNQGNWRIINIVFVASGLLLSGCTANKSKSHTPLMDKVMSGFKAKPAVNSKGSAYEATQVSMSSPSVSQASLGVGQSQSVNVNLQSNNNADNLYIDIRIVDSSQTVRRFSPKTVSLVS